MYDIIRTQRQACPPGCDAPVIVEAGLVENAGLCLNQRGALVSGRGGAQLGSGAVSLGAPEARLETK